MDFAQRLKDLRESRGISQDKLAADINKSKGLVSMYESGKRTPPFETQEIIADYFNVGLDYLMGRDNVYMKISSDSERFAMLPIIGSVAAGVPLEESQDINGYVEVSGDTNNTFALQVHGDSMEPEMHDGDTVIIKRMPNYKNSDIVVARVNGYEYTVKRLKKNNDDIMLIPINRDYDPMVFKNDTVYIEGKVIEVRRQYM